jgi:hypothetical protein
MYMKASGLDESINEKGFCILDLCLFVSFTIHIKLNKLDLSNEYFVVGLSAKALKRGAHPDSWR